MGIGPVEAVVLLAVVVLLPIWWVLRPADVEEWARSYDLDLTPANRAMVETYVRRASIFRRTGFFAGLLVVPPLLERAGFATGWYPALATAGYGVGIAVAEISFRRPKATHRAAGLAARTVEQYLPTILIWLPRLLAPGIVLLGLWSLTFEHGAGGQPFENYPGAGDAEVIAAVVTAAVVLLAVELLERSVVRRAQPASDPDIVAADDALRAQSVHALAGAALALDGLLVYVVLVRPAQADIANPLLDVAALLAPVAGLLACVWFSNRAWRVRRPATSALPA